MSAVKRSPPLATGELDSKIAKLEQSDKSMRRRQFAILMMYSGIGYYGMQRQPENTQSTHPAIENELLDALLKANLITEENKQFPGQVRFQRASKTDRSVSALGQVVSGRFNEEVENPTKVLNQHLPEKIRIVEFMRVTRGFNAKNICSHRVYQYIMPSFALAQKDELLNESTALQYRIQSDTLNKFRANLQNFKGTHNFFNFTSGRDAASKSCIRYMMDLNCSDPRLYDCSFEYLIVDIVGQSFMLHQIRKMIALAIALTRGNCDDSVWDRCFTTTRIDIPRAPGLGLLLDKVMFDHYNKRYGSDGIHQTIDWDRYKDTIEPFKQKFVFDHIMQEELSTKSMLTWISSLQLHTFSVREQGANVRSDSEDSLSDDANTVA
ncbi:tRNA pseudouridine synthase 1 [Cichlidogyrus casuarinus]|uniref:Pseudouridylate synthase 1 homolog n=1 Tax=Cichlidogyrus casuarinus TaxID=1844966 RepID=A0ABD2QBJ9_9PLAT